MVVRSLAKVRLTDAEINALRDAVDEVAQSHEVRWRAIHVFGSRTDLAKKGGDIDLFVEIHPKLGVDIFALKRRIRQAIEARLGEQKLDIVIDDGNADLGAFGDFIKKEARALWTNS